jgi:HAD superfamily hydrolase (TIGR01549 family)
MEAASQAWLVDLDGTLYAPAPVKLLIAAELAVGGWAAAKVLRRFREEHERVRELGLEGDPFALQIARTAEALGRAPADVEGHVRHWMIERPGRWLAAFRRQALLQEIEAFRRAGGRTALVSDYPAQRKLEALGATALFDAVIASGEPGGPTRLKPHPDGYLRAAAAIEVQPAACLVIGDREDADGAAARAAGMGFRRIR